MASSVFVNPQFGVINYDGSTYTIGPMTISAAASLGGIANIALSSSNGSVAFGSRSIISSPADGQFNITNAAASAGIGLDVATDATVKVRTRAQSAYGTVDMLGAAASGAAGGSKGAGAVTSLTAVNGLITAVS